MYDLNEEYESFTLIDDAGNEVEALVLGTFEIEETAYIALAVIKEDENDLEDGDNIIFFKLEKPSRSFFCPCQPRVNWGGGGRGGQGLGGWVKG